jgi:hypothetical protein
MAMTSLTPPTSLSEILVVRTFQPCSSAKREYMRNNSAAKRVASFPPVPALISTTTFLASLGSLGKRASRSRSSSASSLASSALISSEAIERISGSSAESINSRAPASSSAAFRYSA